MHILKGDEDFWNCKPLHDFIVKSGLSVDDVAKDMGMNGGSLRAYMAGSSVPSLRCVCRFADYFGVTLDEMVGRKSADGIMMYLDGEHKNLTEALVKKYRDKARKHNFDIEDGVVSEWPYNFLEKVFGEWNEPLTKDQEDGFNKVMGDFEAKDREIIEKYFRDDKTLGEVGKDYGVSKERIRQKIVQITRKVRHPSRAQYIRYGLEFIDMRKALAMAKKEKAEKEVREVLRKKYAEEINKKIEEKKKEIEVLSSNIDNQAEMTIENFGLSTRAYNCVHRKGIKTVGDLVGWASSGELKETRNIGIKTAKEICQKIYEFSGLDCAPLNDL